MGKFLSISKNILLWTNTIWTLVLFLLVSGLAIRVSNDGEWNYPESYSEYKQSNKPKVFGSQFVGFAYFRLIDPSDIPESYYSPVMGETYETESDFSEFMFALVLLASMLLYIVVLVMAWVSESQTTSWIFLLLVTTLSCSYIKFLFDMYAWGTLYP